MEPYMILKCNCRCMCQQKLLTNTSHERKMCTGCFIGNCKGIRLKKYFGGRFETIKTGQYYLGKQKYYLGNKDVKNAYPQNFNEITNSDDMGWQVSTLTWNDETGCYEMKTNYEKKKLDA